MNFLKQLFSDENLPIGLEERGFLEQRLTTQLRDRLNQIKRAKVISQNDGLNLYYLVGSYLSGNIDVNNPSPEDREMQTWLRALELNAEVLENRKSKLEKGTPQYNEFMYKNTEDVKILMRYLGDMINGYLTDVPLQKAFARPVVRYEYKVNNAKFTGSNFDVFAEEYHIDTPEVVKIYKKEIQRVYVPTYISYAGIGISMIILLTTLAKRKK
jgi:hypothetical protein